MIYKEIYGTANTPFNYITPSGSKLGAWQNTLRERYEKGELPWESIKKLEEIEFKWELENKND